MPAQLVRGSRYLKTAERRDTMGFELIQFEVTERIRTMTLNRSDKLNAPSEGMSAFLEKRDANFQGK
ncbi:MAG: hypothetical protein O7D29_03030 [Gemmatimonadetes bacterium]|nr:hypothetical protein [Gemmatimonadota bacterium]